MFVHLVARTLFGVRPFRDSAAAWDLWRALSRGAQDTVAACLMPNHLHQIEETADPDAARRRLALRLAAFSRKQGWSRLWERLPAPGLIPDARHLLRQVRYVHLNPCRAGLVPDPLCWPWSTHRGAVGAELEPWVTSERMARCLDYNAGGFAAWFHRYVSSDPHVAVSGTPLPAPGPERAVAELPLARVVEAACALAPSPARLRCQLAVVLAYDQGWRDAAVVASALGITSRAVRRLARRDSAELLRVGRLYLADQRLRHVPRL